MRPGLERAIGRLLRPLRAGDRFLAFRKSALDRVYMAGPVMLDQGRCAGMAHIAMSSRSSL
jgi:hypothetical protein